jgi:hypothetical protein
MTSVAVADAEVEVVVEPVEDEVWLEVVEEEVVEEEVVELPCNVTTQAFSIRTSGSPFAPVIGVRVT